MAEGDWVRLGGWLAIGAAALQAAGYALYLRHTSRGDTVPNPASWLMFAYGTAVLALLEGRAGAPWPVLLLPAVCASLSVLVALRVVRALPPAPLDLFEVAAFAVDLALTAAYVALVLADISGPLALALLVVSVAGSVVSFAPIIRSTRRAPKDERPLPWLVWGGAYALLFVAILVGDGPAPLLLYPAVNFVLHASVALLARTSGATVGARP